MIDVMDSDRQMVHAITCRGFFETACPYPNRIRMNSRRVLCNKPSDVRLPCEGVVNGTCNTANSHICSG